MAEEEHNSSSSSCNGKPKVVVILGATGAGKSRLAIDLAQHFPAEILNADSMQVYEGLDVLTNKVPVDERKDVPHHLLGTINPNVEFTSKDFRDMAIPIIDSIISRKRLPIIVGGTNYYIQALVSSYLVDDVMDGGDQDLKTTQTPFNASSDAGKDSNATEGCVGEVYSASNAFDRLKKIDPVAANRLHPNDFRRVSRYLDIFETTGVLPSKIFLSEKSKKWGRADSFRYDCCFLWVDASLPVLDKYVEQRVDFMIDGGLLKEVSGFYVPKADYTRGLRQAIGVREFENFFAAFPPENKSTVLSATEPTSSGSNADSLGANLDTKPLATSDETSNFRDNMEGDTKPLATSDETSNFRDNMEGNRMNRKMLLDDAIKRMKVNTCKLVRRQKRRLNRLKAFFGWNLHQLDVTKALETTGSESMEFWNTMVVHTSIDLVKTFLSNNASAPDLKEKAVFRDDSTGPDQSRDLWTQYVCEACDRVLRGSHEWEQHKLGRSHRRQVLRLKKKFYESANNLKC